MTPLLESAPLPECLWRRFRRSVIALAAGALIGLGVQHWRRQDEKVANGAPQAAAAAVESAVSSAAPPPLDVVKTRAAARAWFTACSPMIEYGDLKNMPPAEVHRVEAMTSAELHEWLEEARLGGVDNALMAMLMERWGEIDQPAFVAWIEMLKRQRDPLRDSGISNGYDSEPPWVSFALQVLRRIDPDTKVTGTMVPIGTTVIIDSVPGDPVPSDEPPAGQKPDLSTLTAGEAVRWLARNGWQVQELIEIAEKMAEKDVRAALAWAQGIPRHLKERREALKTVLRKGRDDGPWLLENVHLLERVEDMQYALTNASTLYGTPEGRASVMDWLLQRTNPHERRAGLMALQDLMYSTGMNEGVAMLARLTDRGDRASYLNTMITRLSGNKNWEKLLPLIAAEPGTGIEPAGAGVAAGQLAEKKSVKQAITWAETLPPDGRRTAALAAAYAVWARQDSAEAVQAALEMPEGEMRTAVMVSLAVVRGERFPGEALQWAQTLTPAERVRILPQLAENLMPHHAVEARTEAAQLLTVQPAAAGNEGFKKAVRKLMPGLGTTTGETAAMQWIESMPASALRAELVEYMTKEAGRSEAVKAWVERQNQVP